MTRPIAQTRRNALLTRSALCGVLGAMAIGGAPALAQVTGVGTITGVGSNGANPSVSSGAGVTDITLGGSRTFINWNTLNVSTSQSLNFYFGNRGDVVVNRVLSGSASIDGILNGCMDTCATKGGNVWILSAGGVMIGANARINSGGFLATTAGLTDADILDGDHVYNFSGTGGSGINIAAGAQITTNGGALALIAPVVTTVAGSTITGGNGADVLYGAAEGYTITFAPDANSDLDLVSFAVPAATGTSQTTGLDLAGATSGGRVFASVVSKNAVTSQLLLTGTITATSASGADGDIVLSAGGGIDAGGVAGPATGGTVSNMITTASAFSATGDATIVSSGSTTWSVASGALGGSGNINITAGDLVSVSNGDGSITLGNVSGVNGVTVSNSGALQNIVVGSATASGAAADVVISSSTGTASLLSGSAGRDLQVVGASASLGTGTAGRTAVVFASNGNSVVTTGITAGDDIQVLATGAVNASGATLRSTGGGASGAAGIMVRSTGSSVSVGSAITEGTGAAAGDIIVQANTWIAMLGSGTSTRDLTVTANGALTLTGDLTAQNAVALDSGGGSITQTGGVITANTLSVSSGGAVSLSQANAVNTLTGGVSNGAFTFRNAGNLTLSGNIQTGGAALTLTSNSGAITQSAGILNAGAATIAAQTGITLGQANTVGSIALSNTVSGGVVYRSAAGINLGQVSNLGRAVTLTADNGSIIQTSALTAGTLNASATGAITLTNAANAIAALGNVATGTGALNLRTSGDLDLTGLVAMGVRDVTLTSAGAITQSGGSVVAGTLNVTAANGIALNRIGNDFGAIGTVSNDSGGVSITDASNIDVSGGITALGQTIILTALTGHVEQTGGAIVGGTLIASGTTGIGLGHIGNDIDAIGGLANVGTGGIVYIDADAFDLAGNITAAGQTTQLRAVTGQITQSAGAITTSTLNVQAAGSATLIGPNSVTTLGNVAVGGGFAYRDIDGFDIGGIAAGAGVSLVSEAGAITQSGSITADSLSAAAATGITLTHAANNVTALGTLINTTSGGISYTDADGFDVGGAVTAGGQTVTLRSVGGGITQALGSVITADVLTATALTGINLSRDNAVTSLGSVNAGSGGFLYRDVDNIALTGNVTSGGTVAIFSNIGSISQTGGVISANGLSAQAVTGISFNQANSIASVGPLTNTGSGGITLYDADGFNITGNITNIGRTVSLGVGAGGITQSVGVIRAGTLTATTVGGLTLNLANEIDELGTINNSSSGGVSITNAKALTVTGDLDNSLGGLNLTTTAGALTVNGTVFADAISLTGATGVAANNTTSLFSWNGVNITATTGDAIVQRVTANGVVTVRALNGDATLRQAALGGISNSITISAGGTATLGADSYAGITAANFVNRVGGNGAINVRSSGGSARVFLNSLNTGLTVVDASLGGTASIGVANGFTVDTVDGRNVVLTAPNGVITAANLTVGGGDYTVTGQDFAGGGVFNPTGTIEDLTIVDTAGGLTLSQGFTVTGSIHVEAANGGGLSSSGILTAGSGATEGDVTLIGSGVSAFRVVADRDVTINAGTGAVALSLVSVNGNYSLTGGSLDAAALSPVGVRGGTWTITDTVGDLALGAVDLNYGGDIVVNVGGDLTGTGNASSVSGGVTIDADGITLNGVYGGGDSVDLTSDGDIQIAFVQAIGDIDIDAGGTASISDIVATRGIDLSAAGNVAVGSATAGDDISLVSNGGTLIVERIQMSENGAGRRLTLTSVGDLRLGAATAAGIVAANTFSRLGSGATSITSLGGDVVINLHSAAHLGDITAGIDALITVNTGDIRLTTATAQAGSISVTAVNGGILVDDLLSSALDLTLVADGLFTPTLEAGRDLTVTTDSSAYIGYASAGDDITLTSVLDGVRLQGAMLSGAAADTEGDGRNLTIAAERYIILGADTEATITAANTLGRGVGATAGSVSLVSATADIDVYLESSNATLTTLSGNTVVAVVAAGDLTIGSLTAVDALLKAPETLAVNNTPNVSRYYSVTASDFTGQALAPAAGLDSAQVIDTAGGLVISDDITVDGALTILSAGMLSIDADLSAGGMISAESHGGMTILAGASLTSTAMGDAIVLASDGSFANYAGAGALTTPDGRWLIYTQALGAPTTPTTNIFGGLDGKSYYGSTYSFGGGAGGSYPFTGTLGAGNRFVYGYRPVLTVTPNSQTVTYNGQIPTLTALITGLINGDLAGDAWSGAPSLSGATSKNVGTYNLAAALGTLASDMNYDFAFGTGTLIINPKALTGTVLVNDKTYDGNTSATGSISLGGVIVGDDVSAGAGYAFADKSAGTNKVIVVTGAALSGVDAGNYTLDPLAAAVADILKKALTGTVTANGKTYDGTTTATGSVSLSGVIAGDDVSASGGAYSFADANAGVGKTVTASGVGLAGVDAGNYTLDPLATAVADILKKALTGTLTANNKTYDGATAATGSISLTGVVAGDDVTAGGTYAFADANAGVGKTVTASGVSLSGTDAGNYDLTAVSNAIADVLRKSLTGTLTASNKTYDGTATAAGSVTLTGIVAGDDVSASGGTFTFADRNAGVGKTVTATGVGLSGADASNYDLTAISTAIADILRKSLTGTLTASNKTYDGTATASASVTLSGVIAGDDVSAGGTYSFADKNAGVGKTVTATGVGLTGADAANYDLAAVSTAIADILRKALTGTVVVQDKTYDGTTSASGSVTLAGVVVGDEVGTTAGTYAFADANAGVGKTITVSGVSLDGADAGNYLLSPLAPSIASILRRAVAVQADDKTKRFGQPDPALTWTLLSGSLVQGDAFSGVLARASGEQAGTYVIGRGSLTLSQNYDLTFTPGAFVINAMPAAGQDSSDVLRRLRQPVGYSLGIDPTDGLILVDERENCRAGETCPRVTERSVGAGAF